MNATSVRLGVSALCLLVLLGCGPGTEERQVKPDPYPTDEYEASEYVPPCGGDYDCKPGEVCADDRCEAVCAKPQPLTVSFETTEARVSEEDIAELEKVALCHRAWPESKLLITGFADQLNAETNKKRTKEEADAVSNRFAKSVEHILTNRYLAATNRIRTESKGAEEAICNTPDESCQKRNRRAELSWERIVREKESEPDFDVNP